MTGSLREDLPALLTHGYTLLSRRRRAAGDPRFAELRLAGMPVVALAGPEAAEMFYDDRVFTRESVMPGFVQDTLVGRGAVHTLAGRPHLARKAMFLDALHHEDARGLVEAVADSWDEAVDEWRRSSGLTVLFHGAGEALTVGVCRWLNVPLAPGEARHRSRDMLSMVDGFGSIGPRHVRSRVARKRSEAWIEQWVRQTRAGVGAPAGRAWDILVGRHRERGAEVLDDELAAVEVLNIIRPTAAIAWFATFAAHALHQWPEHAAKLDDPAYVLDFCHEVRRFYPFAPFLAARAVDDLDWQGVRIPRGTIALLDIFGSHHDETWWPDPYAFDPARFADRAIGPFDLLAQGGGDVVSGHRCPGEDITVSILATIVPKLARMSYEVVRGQDLSIPLRLIPTRPRSGFIIDVR